MKSNYQLLPPLTEDEYRELKEDIQVRGVLTPVEVDEHGATLDGHHRLQIVLELEQETGKKVPYQVVVRAGLSDEDKYLHALSLNLHRRQLGWEQKRYLAEVLVRRFQWSTTKISKLLAVDQSTVWRWLSALNDLPEQRLGDDGKMYGGGRLGGIYAGRNEINQALDSALALGPLSRDVPIKRALVLARQARLDEPWTATVDQEPSNAETRVELRVGSLLDALSDLDDNSVDLILTDPPYPYEFIHVWTDLGVLAARVLKPGCPLVAYTGQIHLPEVMGRLTQEGLEYRWIGGMFFSNQTPQVHLYRVNCGWRPILFLSKGDWQPPRWWTDVWHGSGPEKEIHVWQQSVDTFFDLVERFSNQDDLVVDPFLGSGTTGVAAVRLGRRFIGCDIDPGAVRASRERILGEVPHSYEEK